MHAECSYDADVVNRYQRGSEFSVYLQVLLFLTEPKHWKLTDIPENVDIKYVRRYVVIFIVVSELYPGHCCMD